MTTPATAKTAVPVAPLIHGKMIAVMRDIPAIPKDRKNTQQNYVFRGIDDVYAAVQPILARHGVGMTAQLLAERHEERQSKTGSTLIYCIITMRYHFYAEDGSSVFTEVVGEGMDSGDKAANKAMSVAQKYAILQAFCIPTAEPKDPENENHEVAPRRATEAQISAITDLSSEIEAAGIGSVAQTNTRIQKFVARKFGVSEPENASDLTPEQAEAVIANLQKLLEGDRKAA